MASKKTKAPPASRRLRATTTTTIMSAAEFGDTLDAIGLTLKAPRAAFLECSLRNLHRMETGESEVPGLMAKLLRLMVTRNIHASDMQQTA